MRIAIVGVGSVGGYFGGRLAQAGESVVFVARGDSARVLRERGLRVESPRGDVSLRDIRVVEAGAADSSPVDVVLFAVKTFQLDDAIAGAAKLVGPETFVVPLQNGVDAVDVLVSRFGEARVAGGSCRILGSLRESGVVSHQAGEPSITLGELHGKRTPRVAALQAAFERAGVRCEVVGDIRRALWEKLLFVSALGAVGAVTRANADVIRTLPETRTLLREAMQETTDVARAQGIVLEGDVVNTSLAAIDALAPEAMASLAKDVLAGRRTELEDWSGAIVRRGRALGVATPTHAFLYAALLPQERAARGR